MEGILLGGEAFATIVPIILGLLVLGAWIAGVVLERAADAEMSGRRVIWAEWPLPKVGKPASREEEKPPVRKVA